MEFITAYFFLYIFEIFSLSGKQCKCNSFTFLWLSCFHNSLAGIQFCCRVHFQDVILSHVELKKNKKKSYEM